MKTNLKMKTATLVLSGIFLLSACGTQAQYYSNDYNNGYNNGYNQNNNGYEEYYGYQNEYEGGYADYSMFYDELSPYGTWMQDPYYGFVWRPRVNRNFRPYYSDGSWMMTNLGNMWVSNYNWGWIPFHYGRWTYNNWYGWMWIPGREWAPAWVAWRQGGGMFGWSPLGPGMGYGYNNYNMPMNWWSYVGGSYLYGGDYNRYGYYGNQYNNYYNNTTIINNYGNQGNTRFHAGPRIDDVRKNGGRNVQVYNVSNVNSRIQNKVEGNNIRVFAPNIATTRGNNATKSSTRTPKSFTKIETGKTLSTEGVRQQQPIKQTPPTRVQTQEPIRQTPPTRIQTQEPIRQTPPTRVQTQQPVRQTPPTRIQTQEPVRQSAPTRVQTQQPMRQTPPTRIQTQEPVRQSPPTRVQTQQPVRQTPPARVQTQQPVRQTPPTRVQTQQPVKQQAPTRMNEAPQRNQISENRGNNMTPRSRR